MFARTATGYSSLMVSFYNIDNARVDWLAKKEGSITGILVSSFTVLNSTKQENMLLSGHTGDQQYSEHFPYTVSVQSPSSLRYL